jgi:hypothetical protein
LLFSMPQASYHQILRLLLSSGWIKYVVQSKARSKRGHRF